MPETIIEETTVYTLAELETLFGCNIHGKAIENVMEWLWEGFEPEIITEDMAYMIGEDFPLFELGQVRRGYNGKGEMTYRPNLFWEMNPYTAEGKGTVDVVKFMTERKLRNKYRLLWEIMRKHEINLDAPVAFGCGCSDDCDLSDLQSDIECNIECDTEKVQRQITALEGEIEAYVGEIYSFVLKHLRAEDDYRSSREYAKDEAEAQEFKFTESGRIYHG